MTVLDLGSGTGFPLLELAARLGPGSQLYGVDPWENANNRARKKIKQYGLSNVEIIQASADQMPFDDKSVDLVVSNLGINNFEHPEQVFAECKRVLKQGARLALTTNLNGHWQVFYDIFENTLLQLGKNTLIPAMIQHQEHRGSLAQIAALFENTGLRVCRQIQEPLEMTFLNGTAFLNHYFVKLGWLASWKQLIPITEQAVVFATLEHNLNEYAQKTGCLKLSVPMAYIEGVWDELPKSIA
jgi:arsenite methyltransferase